ncbi:MULTISPECIES: hypothetical protein [Aequorivita]|uniref:Uncharacterized protein n=1 Tax=Aequorivita iocasae TaxID=2803865 RepID=A0ABX7DRL5_9FLAO|nr:MULTISPECIES: hypothetical protein [Aequorivita]QQX76450.1 hypothetical protein JK629_14170 [Aequorivita iocasae]UCA55922.1 hypothetical protein LDL78_14240 [Aequorivita sp. F7]
MEGRENGGYDMGINGNIFFQFKIPNYITRKNAKNIHHWNVFNDEFYRIKINTNSRQFELLKQLSNPLNNVYYATPDFHTDDSLLEYYQCDRIVFNSAIFDLNGFPPPGSGHHNLVYKSGERMAILFSQPIEIKKTQIINPNEMFFERQKQRVSIYEQAREIFKILKENDFLNESSLNINDNFRSEFVKFVHNILLTKFDIHWYPVLSRRN